jgi:uncharacterized protein
MVAQEVESEQDLATKEKRLREVITGIEKVAVAFSGGVDSSYLLAMCADALGSTRVHALTADSPLLPRAELKTARRVARQLGVVHRVVPFDELGIPEVVGNTPRRCYDCKRARFEALLELVSEPTRCGLLSHTLSISYPPYPRGIGAGRASRRVAT